MNEDCLINYYEFAVFAENWEGPERIPPAVPTGLLAWAGDGMVTLDWADNTESDLLGYNVYRSETSGSGYILLNPEPLTASAYVDTSVQNGLTYYYVVTAVDNLLNESAYSSEVIAAPDSITTIVIQENEPGFIGVFTGTIDSNNAGFTGTGFANTNNAVGMYIEWSVYAASAGTYQLQWRYANGSTNNRTGAVSVGGVTQATAISFPSTGGWTSWTTSALVPVSLSAGSNRIRLIAEMSEGLANIDWMSVTGVSPLPGS